MDDMTIFAKLSAKLYLNVKVRSFAAEHPQAAFLWVLAITYCVDRRTDGHVDEFAFKTFLGATDDDLAALEAAGLIHADGDGYRIHDFADAQVCTDRQAEIRAKRAEAGRMGGKISKRVSKPQASDKQTVSKDKQTVSKIEAAEPHVSNDNETFDDGSRISKNKQTEANGKQTASKNKQNIEIEREREYIPPYSPPTGDGADGFAEAWETYPKHTGSRRSAHDAYTDTLTRIDADSLHTAVRRYARNSPDRKWTPTFRNWLTSEQWREWAPKHDPQPKPAAPHRHTATCRHVLAHMNPVRDQYPARTDGLGPSPEYAAACQAYADQLNKEEQPC
ncbi:hypothetical protein [Bifidobacterium animalis]|uniref:hypothetical protein n=1 Tax=Bifidobacterium animalis TaxID=28025 RepID=UPI003F91D42F